MYLLIRWVFGLSKLRDLLVSFSRDTVIEYMERALKEENYELAAVLKYYLEFKKFQDEKPLKAETK